MTDKKLNEAYQRDYLWTGSKVIRRLHEITPIPKKMSND